MPHLNPCVTFVGSSRSPRLRAMPPEEPTTARTPDSAEDNGGWTESAEASGATDVVANDINGGVSTQTQGDSDAGVLTSPKSDAAGMRLGGQAALDKVRSWARRWGVSGDGTGGQSASTEERRPMILRWPGAPQPETDGSAGTEVAQHVPQHAQTSTQQPDAGHDAHRSGAAPSAASQADEAQDASVEPTSTAVTPTPTPMPMPPTTSPDTAAPTVPLPIPRTPEPTDLPSQPSEEPPPTPMPRRRKRGRRRSKGRLVRERLRHIGPWSVFKVASLFYICLVLTFLAASVGLWQLGRNVGTIDEMENFISRLFSYGDCVPRDEVEPGIAFQIDEDCPDDSVLVGGFEVDDPTLFRSALIGGGIFIGAATIGTVLLAVFFNLLSDVTGGVRYTVVRGTADQASGSTNRRARR